MAALQSLPIVLSFVLLGAHFLRARESVLLVLSLVLIGLLFVRRPWAARVLQLALVAGALEWVWTVVQIARWRAEAGMPFLRMVAILGAVAALTGLSALMFRTRTLRRRFAHEERAENAASSMN